MGNAVYTQTDYYWSYTDEPHATRRKEILKKYPQVKELYGHEWSTKYIVTGWVLSQWLCSYLVRNSSWWVVTLLAYCYGGFASHALVLAMHEISHNLAFPKAVQNKALGIFANMGTAFPHFSMFQKYHLEHHQFQGVSGIDVDVPSDWEGKFFTNTFKKLLWVFFQPCFYIFRPFFVKPKNPGMSEVANWGAVIAFDVLWGYLFGWQAVFYLFLSTYLGSGLHPCAGHFIAEHYVFIKGQETYSYYGPLNLICFNVGYHNEHHDFPRIPGRRLPALKAMIPEYYDHLPSYTSWTKVIWDYIVDPTVGPYSRVMRKTNRLTAKDGEKDE
jgi:sphingolipid 4-desaturase/C4-monooxygenase